jgi:hypothetical protein
LDHAAQIQELRSRVTRRERESPRDQLVGTLGLTGRPGCLGGGGESMAPATLVGTQLGRADECCGGRCVSGASLVTMR